MNNRKGYAAVEAAMVFPLVIFSVIAIFFMMVSMYQVTAESARFHTYLRYEAGQLNDTFNISPYGKTTDKIRKTGVPANYTLSSDHTIHRENYVFLGEYSKKITGKARSVDEETIIRAKDYAVKEKLKDE